MSLGAISAAPLFKTLSMNVMKRQAVAKYDEDVKSFVCDDFYVDDGLTSLTNKE
jgi:hypothetical protein